jgi:proline-specific peptidase
VDEVEGVRQALRLGRVHLFGNSYGGALALDVALKYQRNLKSLIVSSGFADFALLAEEQARLFSHLPRAVREKIAKYEVRHDITNPEYMKVMDVWWRRHGCRLRVWPYEVCQNGVKMSEHLLNMPKDTMAARLRGWNITSRLPEIELPCLVVTGQYDAVTLKCVRPVHNGIHGSKLVIFGNASHTQMWEDRARFVEVVRDFLDSARGGR